MLAIKETMISRRYDLQFSVYLLLLALCMAISGCEHRPAGESPPVKFDLHEKTPEEVLQEEDILEEEQVDIGDVLPPEEAIPGNPRIQSPEAYPWAPQDRPIRFHTVEESGETRDAWGPYVLLARPNGARPPEVKLPEQTFTQFAFHVRTDIQKDAELASIREAGYIHDRESGSIFIGLGGAFMDEYYHVFECRHPTEVAWFQEYPREVHGEKNIWYQFYARGVGYYMEDYFVYCRFDGKTLQLNVYILSGDEFNTEEYVTEPVEEMAEAYEILHRTKFVYPIVSRRFGELWVDAVTKDIETRRAWIPIGPPFPPIDNFETMEVSFYYSELKAGASSNRMFIKFSKMWPALSIHWNNWIGLGR